MVSDLPGVGEDKEEAVPGWGGARAVSSRRMYGDESVLACHGEV